MFFQIFKELTMKFLQEKVEANNIWIQNIN